MSILAPGFSFACVLHRLPAMLGTTLPSPALLGATTMPADSSEIVSTGLLIGLAATLLLALMIALATGVFRPSRVDGPLRLGIGRPTWPLAMVIGIGVVLWIGSNIFYVAVKQTIVEQQARAATGGLPATRPSVMHPTVIDFAVLSTVPGLLAFAWLFYADGQLVRISQLQLGFTRRRLVDGISKGLLASVMILPAMFAASILMEALYECLQYRHPGEHELLRLMNEAPTPLLRWCLIGGAIITAPFFEEYLFRGFLQTFLRQAFITLGMRLNPVLRPLPAGTFAPSDPFAQSPEQPLPVAPSPVTTVEYREPTTETLPPAQGERVWQTWAAIFVTSLVFASIHEAWTAPLIFMLAVFLGYAYERTGSLWTTITIHLVFNTTSTVIYLMGSHGG